MPTDRGQKEAPAIIAFAMPKAAKKGVLPPDQALKKTALPGMSESEDEAGCYCCPTCDCPEDCTGCGGERCSSCGEKKNPAPAMEKSKSEDEGETDEPAADDQPKISALRRLLQSVLSGS